MSPLNLDPLSGFLPAEPASPAPGPPPVDPPGQESFGEHLDRARQAAGASADPDPPPADASRPPDPQTPRAADDHAAADDGSAVVEPDENTTGRPDPDPDERDRTEDDESAPDANGKINDSETDVAAGNASVDAATKSTTTGEIPGEPAAPEDGAPVRRPEVQPNSRQQTQQNSRQQTQQNSRQAPAASAGQPTGPPAATGNLVPDQPQEQGRVQAETTPEENADAASRTEAEKATRASETTKPTEDPTRQVSEAAVAESPDEPNAGVPAASGPESTRSR